MNTSPKDNVIDSTRRHLLRAGAMGLGVALLPWQGPLAQAASGAASSGTMRKRKIPSTGDMLAVMGLGSSGAFSTSDPKTLADLHTVMSDFVAMGGQMVDTSPTYGNAETNIGNLARKSDLRYKLFMATKVHIDGKQAGIEQIQKSEASLGKPIDLMQIHNFVDIDTQWATLKQMKAAGQVRYIGITHYRTSAFDELERQMKQKKIDFVQFNYSVMTPDAEKRLLPLAAERGIAVVINRAFDDGRFFGQVRGRPLPAYAKEFDCSSWAQFALKYVLAHPAVNTVIPATSDPTHLRDNMQAGYGALPDADQLKRMRATVAAL